MPGYLDLAMFKTHVAVDHSYSDAIMTSFLDAAELYIGDVENGILHRPVVSTTFVEAFPDFDSVCIAHPDEVTAFAVATGGVDVSAATYTLKNGALSLNYDQTWPTVAEGQVTATYTAGWDVASIPAPIVNAGYFYAATLFEQRSGGGSYPEKFRQHMAMALAGYRRRGI